jgi:PAS domain-containing protein
MRYQVVLQWPASSLNDYDGMVDVENLLIEKLTEQSEVDGHDFGSTQTNIFVHTDDPRRAFEEIRTILSGHRLWWDARIAYRQIDGTEYTVLWPQGATTFNVS